mgnify:CR=1 FL=1
MKKSQQMRYRPFRIKKHYPCVAINVLAGLN